MTFKSYAKINIFLKIVGKRGDYHEIISRFVRYEKLYDELFFVSKEKAEKGFLLEGNFDCETKNNTIFKSYEILRQIEAKKIDDFFENHFVKVQKNIPSGSGLGGGSSNAAAFILALNETLKLSLGLKKLLKIGSQIGADVNFFLHNCHAANVEGVGEKVTPIEDKIPEIELVLNNEHCSTAVVYKSFRENCWNFSDVNLAKNLSKINSCELLKRYDNLTLNDLLRGVLICYPNLKIYADKHMYLSGSGSTFFKVSK